MIALPLRHLLAERSVHRGLLCLDDANQDGAVEGTETVAAGYPNVHGVAFTGDSVYLATDKRVIRGVVDENGDFTNLTDIILDLPDGGQHPYRTLGIGADGMLYVSVGSSCDACRETNPEHATILRAPTTTTE